MRQRLGRCRDLAGLEPRGSIQNGGLGEAEFCARSRRDAVRPFAVAPPSRCIQLHNLKAPRDHTTASAGHDGRLARTQGSFLRSRHCQLKFPADDESIRRSLPDSAASFCLAPRLLHKRREVPCALCPVPSASMLYWTRHSKPSDPFAVHRKCFVQYIHTRPKVVCVCQTGATPNG